MTPRIVPAKLATILTFLSAMLATVALAGLLDTSPATRGGQSRTPVEHARGTEQTYLTFPEWFLVHSPAEYATYVEQNTPSAFPFIAHVRQFWHSYAVVSAAANDGNPFNFGYHVMIVVIGTSTTVEYGLRSAYETLVGRLSELTQSGGLTAEDRYGARVAREYVDFIRIKPWYEFDFSARLASLWKETTFTGPDLIRKWERKYALTTEYAVKAAYAWLIMKATRASYDEAAETTAVLLDRLPADAAREIPMLKVLKTFDNGEVLATVPRYHAFKQYAAALARHQVSFLEIAGNRGPILVSVLSKTLINPEPLKAKILFTQPILTEIGSTRVALVIPVPSLSVALTKLSADDVVVEHIYDY